MSNTLKAVFECKELQERQVWWVGSRREAHKHLYHHICTSNGKRLTKYKKHEWTFTIGEVFGDKNEVHYDPVGSWSGS